MTLDPRLAAVLGDLFGLPADALHPDAELEGELQLDSLSVVELQVALEDAYGVELAGQDELLLRTLGDLQRLLGAAVALQRQQEQEDEAS